MTCAYDRVAAVHLFQSIQFNICINYENFHCNPQYSQMFAFMSLLITSWANFHFVPLISHNSCCYIQTRILKPYFFCLEVWTSKHVTLCYSTIVLSCHCDLSGMCPYELWLVHGKHKGILLEGPLCPETAVQLWFACHTLELCFFNQHWLCNTP